MTWPERHWSSMSRCNCFKNYAGVSKRAHSIESHYLVGSTLHKIGVIQMWQGKYHEALASFQGAVANQADCLSPNHPDIGLPYPDAFKSQFSFFCSCFPTGIRYRY